MYALFMLFSLGGLLLLAVTVYHSSCWNLVVGSGAEVNRSWLSSFECGFMGQASAENMFSYTYFMLLVFFVVFDLEISLLLNLPFQGSLYYGAFAYVFFLVLLSFGYLLELRNGYMRWSY